MSAAAYRAPWYGLALLGVMLGATLSGCSHNNPEQTFQYQGGDLRGGAIDYDQMPPAGGPYSPLWQRCAAYTRPIYPEYALHSVARGAVWLTYRPDLAPSDIQELAKLVTDKANKGVIVSPLPGQAAAVVATAWNVQRHFDGADVRGASQFIDHHAGSKDVPEAGAGCADGQTEMQGGTL